MSSPLYIAFVWHMHQPSYRDMATGVCHMPWVRLHATKDYLDMLTRLEQFPSLHQTFNLVPSLLDQLEAYLPPHHRSDEFLDLSRKPAAELSEPEQRFLLRWFFLANPERMIYPHPRYHDLLAKRGAEFTDADRPDVRKRFLVQDYLDLQVWFNLAWIDPWLRRQRPALTALEAKGSRFTEEDKSVVLASHLELIAGVIPAYRAAAERGTIELSASPYFHPIMPLLCDGQAARAALPDVSLPNPVFRHPEDARWQLTEAFRRHAQAFGHPPRGLWPPEGGVSEPFVRLACEAGLRWIATDEEILWRTLKTPRSPAALYRPHRLQRPEGQVAIVFRDRELSDLLGFVYSRWEARRAAADFIGRLARIHQQAQASERPMLVTIILDGENAWESYPDDGHEFLTALYTSLAADDRFRCVTVSEFLERYPLDQTPALPELFSGSWIDANFATWIGHPEKNAAWERLAEARGALEPLPREDPAVQQAWRHLGAAEGSDWMWWFGDTHFSAQAEEFDRLFRTHLANGYRAADLPVPANLDRPIRRIDVAFSRSPTGLIRPVIDGRETSYYEWLYAGIIDLRQQFGAMQRAHQVVQRLHYGSDGAQGYLRLDVDRVRLRQLTDWRVVVRLGGADIEIGAHGDGVRAHVVVKSKTVPVSCALNRILELAVPLDLADCTAHQPAALAVALRQGGEELERYPTQGVWEVTALEAEPDAQAWSA
ncbi:MAG: glycoside hydrolase [Candidatus Omnitrophica bacterium]|nr:glycoside hydrolase [Candidatus Omnitrophota bacterium]